MTIVARSQYDSRPSVPSDLSFQGDKGLTKQADAKDCDLNVLFKRFERTGQLPDMIAREPHYGDYSDVPSYEEACNIVIHAREQFDNLDARIRNRFENDPAKFLAFASDPKNIDEMAEMGLLNEQAMLKRKAAIEADNAKAKADFEAKAKAEEQAFIEKVKKAIQG